jgi:hypothetical protein
MSTYDGRQPEPPYMTEMDLARSYESILQQLCEADDPVALLADFCAQAGLPAPKAAAPPPATAAESVTLRDAVAALLDDIISDEESEGFLTLATLNRVRKFRAALTAAGQGAAPPKELWDRACMAGAEAAEASPCMDPLGSFEDGLRAALAVLPGQGAAPGEPTEKAPVMRYEEFQ